MRVLVVSNFPTANTGYGVVVRNLLPRFKKFLDVILFAYYGTQSNCTYEWKGIKILPKWHDPWGRDIADIHFKQCKADCLLQIYDIWATPQLPLKVNRVIAYSPVDTRPVSPYISSVLKKCWKVVPFTHEAYKELKKAGVICAEPIPHGVDEKIFHPDKKLGAETRKWMGFEKDDFVIGIFGGNYDKMIRKRFDKDFEAIRYFLDQNPDAKVKIWLHSEVLDMRSGVDLLAMAKAFGLGKITKSPNQYLMITGAIDDRKMAALYNACDVVLNLSQREGWGLPPFEAYACKTPAIQTDYINMHELTIPELRVKVQAYYVTGLIAPVAIADSWDAAQKLEKLWKSPDFYKKCAEKGFKLTEKYHWDDIVEEKWKPFFEKCKEEIKEINEMMSV